MCQPNEIGRWPGGFNATTTIQVFYDFLDHTMAFSIAALFRNGDGHGFDHTWIVLGFVNTEYISSTMRSVFGSR